ARAGGFGRNARWNFWTRPWTLVNVPSFSAREHAGSWTSAARVRALAVRAATARNFARRRAATFRGSSAASPNAPSAATSTFGDALPERTSSRPEPPAAGDIPMSLDAGRFAPEWSPSIQPAFDFIFRTRDLSTTASRFGLPT